MSILDIFNSNPEGNTPIEQASPLRRFLIGLGGQESVDMYNQPALTQLGADLASGTIDQTQYDRRMAQYAPKEYQKMRLLQMGNGRPSALQINDEMERALQAGDYEKANRIFSLVRSQAYGVDTYSPERNPYAQPQQQGSALRNFGTQPAIQPFANQRPTVTDLPVIEQPPSVDNPMPTETDNFPKPSSIPTGTDNIVKPSSIAEQWAANAGLVKGAEETAKQNAILEKAAAIEEEKTRGRGEIPEDKKKATGQKQVNTIIDELTSDYNKLNEKKAITSTANTPKQNLSAYIRSTGIGQGIGKMVGTEEQSIRNGINMQIPGLISAIRNATGMSSKSMDSNAELQFYLQQASNPKLDIEVNLGALKRLKAMYGLAEGEDTTPILPPTLPSPNKAPTISREDALAELKRRGKL